MDITPLVKEGAQIIQSYAGGRFKISGRRYDHPVIVFPDQTLEWNVPEEFAGLQLQHFQPLIDRADEIDVVLLGTGTQIAFLHPDLRQALKERGLIVEAMDTGAACRTFNVLITEGRRVIAGLYNSIM